MNEIDLTLIKSLLRTQSVAKACFEYWASRKNGATETTVDTLLQVLSRNGGTFTRNEVIRFLKDLETAKCGTFISGRHGNSSRITWDVNIVTLGQTALGQRETVEDRVIEDDDESDDSNVTLEEVAAGITEDNQFNVVFPLRPEEGFSVSLVVPRNITAKEAKRLADYILTLPEG
ncbi:MAG TPA: hypothetical protein VIT91_09145 [Chthoniobacterales bacterium]